MLYMCNAAAGNQVTLLALNQKQTLSNQVFFNYAPGGNSGPVTVAGTYDLEVFGFPAILPGQTVPLVGESITITNSNTVTGGWTQAINGFTPGSGALTTLAGFTGVPAVGDTFSINLGTGYVICGAVTTANTNQSFTAAGIINYPKTCSWNMNDGDKTINVTCTSPNGLILSNDNVQSDTTGALVREQAPGGGSLRTALAC